LAEAKQPPEGWIGEKVYLRYGSGEKRDIVRGVLESVGAFGVTLLDKEEPSFFPWHAVLEIAPVSKRQLRRASGSS
jgi:hypothetical protein